MAFRACGQCANVFADRKGMGTVIDFGSDGREVVATSVVFVLEKH